jgi:FeS assembly SUF system protein
LFAVELLTRERYFRQIRGLEQARAGGSGVRQMRRGETDREVLCSDGNYPFMTDTIEAKTSNMETRSALPPEETERLGTEIVAALKTVFDPEIPADIYELGLIYKVDIKDDRTVDVEMTLTTPNCPAAAEMPTMVENAVASVPGVGMVNVNIVWEPPWTPDRMTDEARLVLNMW